MEEKQERCRRCHGGILHATLNPNFYIFHSEGKNMVSYQPIRLNFEDLPNDFMIKTIAVLGNGLTALEKKKMALCGGKNQWGEVCRLPVFYSKDMCEINWGDFISYVNFCPECKEERESTLQFCTRHSPAIRLQKQEKSQ